jgi:hypothetical protein
MAQKPAVVDNNAFLKAQNEHKEAVKSGKIEENGVNRNRKPQKTDAVDNDDFLARVNAVKNPPKASTPNTPEDLAV